MEWIRNLNDGKVEAILEDYEINVSRVIEWCCTGSPEANKIASKIFISLFSTIIVLT